MIGAIASIVGEVLPSMLGLFAGEKAADAASDVANIVKKVTGTDDMDAAKTLIASDPALALKLKEVMLKEKNFLEKMYLEDVQDARDMYETASQEQSDKIANSIMKNNSNYVLLIVVLQIAFFFIAPQYITLDNGLVAIIANLCGIVITKLLDERLQVVTFFFGSSQSSRAKDNSNNKISSGLTSLLKNLKK